MSITGNRKGYQQSYMRENWRDHKDVKSFYFTRFPDDTAEEDLWQHFKKAGDVREIFIYKKRNRNGRKYGFVRFKGVEDKRQLERKLDNIIFGGLKMYVNLPKFGRVRDGKSQQGVEGRSYINQGEEENRDAYLRMKQGVSMDMKRGSYADVVRRNNLRAEQGYSVNKEGNTGNRFDSIEDDILWEFDDNISPKYIGDDMILLLGLTDDKARQLMDDENEGGATMFHTLDKWHPGMRPGHRLTWVHCWSIPLIAWDMQQMKKVVAGIGDLVAVDDDVEELRKLDMARILLKTPWRPLIQHTINVHIQGEIFQNAHERHAEMKGQEETNDNVTIPTETTAIHRPPRIAGQNQATNANQTSPSEMAENHRASGDEAHNQAPRSAGRDDHLDPADKHADRWVCVPDQGKVSTDSTNATKHEIAGLHRDTTDTNQGTVHQRKDKQTLGI
ncbi:hypothetical protein HKD37_05G012931 [Glycine soja]